MRKALLLALAAATVSALGLAAGEASAHARLIRAEPKVGATVHVAPKALRLSYSETIVPADSAVEVKGPAGAAVAAGPIALDPKNPRVVLLPFKAPLGAGAYHVSWRMKTADGHTTDGDFSFAVK